MHLSADDQMSLGYTDNSLPGLLPFPHFGHCPSCYSAIWSPASPTGMEEETSKVKWALQDISYTSSIQEQGCTRLMYSLLLDRTLHLYTVQPLMIAVVTPSLRSACLLLVMFAGGGAGGQCWLLAGVVVLIEQ